MGATDEQKHDVDYCVGAALVQLEDLEGELREEALRRLAVEAFGAANAAAAANGIAEKEPREVICTKCGLRERFGDSAPPFVQIAMSSGGDSTLFHGLDADGRVWRLKAEGWVRVTTKVPAPDPTF